MILAPPDTGGLLAAAALRRQLGLDQDVQFLWGRELARRLSALADEPEPTAPVVVDLLPTDSVQSLVVPALERLDERGVQARWYYGLPEPAPALLALSELIDLVYEEGAHSWRLVLKEHRDANFLQLADAIEGESTEQGRAWRMVLRAITTSWDWTRIYESLASLASLESVSESESAWARSQLSEAERADALVRAAPTRSVQGTTVAVVSDPTIPARVRPEIFHSARPDADAIAFVAGPARVVFLTTHAGGHIAFLKDLEADERLTVGSIGGPRVDVAWRPGPLPTTIASIVGAEAFEEAGTSPGAGAVARVSHHASERIAKGLDTAQLAPDDLSVIMKGLEASTDQDGKRTP
jgi:hypothetical protein